MKMHDLEKYILDPSLKLWLPLALLDAPAAGANVRSRDAYGVVFTPTGPFWTPAGWYFDGLDDQLIAPAASTTHLDFTSEDYSVVARLRYDDAAQTQHIISRFQWAQLGWAFWINGSGGLQSYTFQGGASQSTGTPNLLVDGQVYTIGFTRRGASIRIYVDNVSSGRNLGVGCSAYATGYNKGLMKAVAVWSRALAPQEHAAMHSGMKEVFG